MFTSHFCVGKIGSALMVFALWPVPQAASQSQPLGDVARQQKEISKQEGKHDKPVKTLTNDYYSSESTIVSAGVPVAPGQVDSDDRNTGGVDSMEQQQEKARRRAPDSSILDRSKDSRPDVIVIPVGTELKVDIEQHKIIVPVRVGFATPIPALSQVTVEVRRSFESAPYVSSGSSYSNYDAPFLDYVEYATVTAVTVAGKTYPVQTDSLPLSSIGTNSEVKFVLGEPIKILR
jgi:hypothetical protein